MTSSDPAYIRGVRGDRRQRRTTLGNSVEVMRIADALLPDPHARLLIGNDPNFQDSVAATAARLTHIPAAERGQAVVDLGWDRAFMLLKPDAIARRLVPAIIDIVRENGFEPVSSRVVDFDDHMVSELWRFQANRTEYRHRDDIIKPYLTAYPSLAVILSDTHPNGDRNLPAAVRFMGVKRDIRTRLGVASTMLDTAHSSDDGAQVIREAYVTADRRDPGALLVPYGDIDINAQLRTQTVELYKRVPQNDLAFLPAVKRLADAVSAIDLPAYGGEPREARDRLLDSLADLAKQADPATRSDPATRMELWEEFAANFEYLAGVWRAPDIETLDYTTVGTNVMEYFRPGNEKYLVEPWREAEWQGAERPVLEGATL
jgi:hypothetical protein